MSRRRRPGVPVARPRDRLRGLIEMRAWEAAVDEARRVVVSEPDSARAYAYMAQALVELKRYDEGMRAAETAIGLDPMPEWHHRLRGLALRGLERHEESLACLEEAVRLEPESTRALHELANCQARCCQWDEMLWTAQRYERLAPDLEAPFHLQANALWGMGNIAGASAAYAEALRLSLEDCPQLHAHVGRLRLWEGRTLDAIECNLHALRMNPGLQFFEAALLYAVRRHLDTTGAPPWQEESGGHASPSWRLALLTQLHVLAMRVPGIYILLSNREAPKLTYQSQLSEPEWEEARLALAEWSAEISDEQVPMLTDLGLPNDLARSLVEGKTAHCPEGVTLDTMLRHWMMTVLDLERGYARDLNDFHHDLLVRDAVEWIAGAASPSPGRKVHEVLAPWDARFQDSTIETNGSGLVHAGEPNWWWGRVPRRRMRT